MAHRARIIISDDLMTLDETDVIYKDKKQLDGMVSSFMRCTADAEVAEVYGSDGKMVARYVLTRKGKLQETSVTHYNWGGRREGSGRPSKGAKALRNKIFFNVSDEMFDALDKIPPNRRSAWLRDAVKEKFERESNEKSLGHGE